MRGCNWGMRAALGFEAEEEAEADDGKGGKARRFYVLNRVYIDDVRSAVALLEGGQALLRPML
jgi:hypothetical protein